MAGALRESHVALTLRATRDSLTGLLNRASLTESLASSFRPGAERRTLQEGVLFIDVDDFKEVNDSLGHHGGDALLIQLASAPQRVCASARFGGQARRRRVCHCGGRGRCGDCGQVRSPNESSAACTSHSALASSSVVVSVSIGAAVRLAATADAAELLRNADFAMYMAKGSGKNRFQLFDAAVHDSLVGPSDHTADLGQAV